MTSSPVLNLSQWEALFICTAISVSYYFIWMILRAQQTSECVYDKWASVDVYWVYSWPRETSSLLQNNLTLTPVIVLAICLSWLATDLLWNRTVSFDSFPFWFGHVGAVSVSLFIYFMFSFPQREVESLKKHNNITMIQHTQPQTAERKKCNLVSTSYLCWFYSLTKLKFPYKKVSL